MALTGSIRFPQLLAANALLVGIAANSSMLSNRLFSFIIFFVTFFGLGTKLLIESQVNKLKQRKIYHMNILAITKLSLLSLMVIFPMRLLSSPYDSVGRYDVVSYFEIRASKNPKVGSSSYVHKWNGKTWYFSSQKNKDLFKANPKKYAPAYHGYCAYAVGNNYIFSADPLAWTIENDRLFLNYNKGVRSDWLQKSGFYIEQGDKNWPKLRN